MIDGGWGITHDELKKARKAGPEREAING